MLREPLLSADEFEVMKRQHLAGLVQMKTDPAIWFNSRLDPGLAREMPPTKAMNHCVAASLVACWLASIPALGADQISLRFRPSGLQGELKLHSQLALPVSAMYPEYVVQRSVDAANWETVAGPFQGGVGVSDETLDVMVPLAGDRSFYRVAAEVRLASAGSRLGEAVYGYGTEFSRQLQALGQISLGQFVHSYGLTNEYLSQVSFDPTQAVFWDQFNLDPQVHNATNQLDPRATDFRLNPKEFELFQTNGFVVSPRLGGYSFADSFYKIYSDDLPVFVSTDAILQAWHRSFQLMLEEIEETYLSPWLEHILASMAGQVPGLGAQAQGAALADGVLDADYFLAVALSLLTGTNQYGSLGQDAQIQAALTAINGLQPKELRVFGVNRVVDFSQFQLRGHYETSQRLGRYFRAMMWCALVDFRFSGFEFTSPRPVDNSLRELSGAVALNILMARSSLLETWLQLNQVLEMFIGPTDSMNFAQLGDLLAASGIMSPADLPNTGALTELRDRIMSGQLGVQNIRSGYFWSPLGPRQIKLPRSFAVMGQRFVFDAWAQSQCVFDSILWDKNKVMRRVPSALDVAFSVLGNSQVIPILTERMSKTGLTPADGREYWRDGRPYQHNLAAARNVIDRQSPQAWTNSIYSSWLACLRELSAPTTEPEYPQVMRTRNWAMKTLNTQLASWTQLRHDAALYAKQPYTGMILCFYPTGYVEPRPRFWMKMKELALRTKDVVSRLPNSSPVPPFSHFTFERNPSEDSSSFIVSIESLRTEVRRYLDFFADTMTTLQGISEKELAGAPLLEFEEVFLRRIVEDDSLWVYAGTRRYSGWYPKLMYLNARGYRSTSFAPYDRWDALVTDVHTNPRDEVAGDPGSILHEAVGNVHLLMLAVDCGPDNLTVYAGPVLSHYEFELGPTARKTNSEWKDDVRLGRMPPQPDWTRGYLVPGPYSVPWYASGVMP